MKLAGILILGALSSVSLHAQEAPPAATAPAPEKKICKKIVPVGTIMAKRFCLTRSEWANLTSRTEADADTVMRARGAGMCGGGDGRACSPGTPR